MAVLPPCKLAISNSWIFSFFPSKLPASTFKWTSKLALKSPRLVFSRSECCLPARGNEVTRFPVDGTTTNYKPMIPSQLLLPRKRGTLIFTIPVMLNPMLQNTSTSLPHVQDMLNIACYTHNRETQGFSFRPIALGVILQFSWRTTS